MFTNACRTCSTIILVFSTNNITAFWRCRCGSRCRFLKSTATRESSQNINSRHCNQFVTISTFLMWQRWGSSSKMTLVVTELNLGEKMVGQFFYFLILTSVKHRKFADPCCRNTCYAAGISTPRCNKLESILTKRMKLHVKTRISFFLAYHDEQRTRAPNEKLKRKAF